MAIIGGGVIGVEMATVFAKLGVRVTIFEMMPQIIPGEDAQIATALSKSLRSIGIDITTDARVHEILEGTQGVEVVAISKDGERRISAECVLNAVGREPRTQELGLEELSVKLTNQAIVVDNKMESTVPGIFAIGDAVAGMMYAHVASREGMVAVENALGRNASMEYRTIPRCIYTTPEVASVGLTEQQAIEEGYDIEVGKFDFLANARAKITEETEGFAKVIVDQQYREVLGVHIIGPCATELIAQPVLACKAELSAEVVRANIVAHPTFSEAIFEAFEDVAGQAIHIPPWSR
jgi:dihydrolipoamide dehydrogenase